MSQWISITGMTIVLLVGNAFGQGVFPPLPEPLKLPPGLEQEIDIHPESSYFGDAMRVVHCPDPLDRTLGTCGNLLFGGLAMLDVSLQGRLKVRFSTPEGNTAHFEILAVELDPLDEPSLVTPRLFKFPVSVDFLDGEEAFRAEGDLNLVTGEVTNFTSTSALEVTGLRAIRNLNPGLNFDEIQFPGQRGSIHLEFSQRSDGLLDLDFFATAFVPTGLLQADAELRFPLPFCSKDLNCGYFLADGTSLHPHLRLSTRSPSQPACGENCPEIPTNTVWELTTFTRETAFGDAFRLNIPELGGNATGRSHLIGRIQLQFGDRFGDAVSVAVSSLPPEGLMAQPPDNPLSFRGLSLGLLGHDEFLKFPEATYFLEDVAFADEPFDIAVGAVDVRSGHFLEKLLYRGFIAQDLLFELLDLNPDIPRDSFFFRGPARFEAGPNGETVFHFSGLTRLSFEDFLFPMPNLQEGWEAGPGSVLEPFFVIEAMKAGHPPASDAVPSESGTRTASTGDTFGFNFSIPCSPRAGSTPFFEYQNTDGPTETAGFRGTFRMHTLAVVSCTNSKSSTLPPGHFDTVTFSGFGTWNGEGLHLVTAQFSLSEEEPYISILVDGGTVSNVNTKPAEFEVPGQPEE